MEKTIKLAFCLYKYFPFGGLQTNFINISKECLRRGYQVDVYTISWEGERLEKLNIMLLPVSGFTNHMRYKSFVSEFNKQTKKKQYDAVVGFNKMPGLDIYYAADVSYAAKMKDRSIFYHLTGRYRALMGLEKSVFSKKSKTHILLLTDKEIQFYKGYYGTAIDRFHLMPPGISKACIPPENSEIIRTDKRIELNIDKSHNIILMICTNFKIKGVGRSITALSSLPPHVLKQTRLLIVGNDNPGPYKRLSREKNILDNVEFLGARSDVPKLLMASNLLLHPASIENTGTVIVEALAARLPVITTDICGFSSHVTLAEAGIVVRSPFRQEELDKALLFMLTSEEKNKWRNNAKKYIENTDVFSRAERAVDIIEKVCL